MRAPLVSSRVSTKSGSVAPKFAPNVTRRPITTPSNKSAPVAPVPTPLTLAAASDDVVGEVMLSSIATDVSPPENHTLQNFSSHSIVITPASSTTIIPGVRRSRPQPASGSSLVQNALSSMASPPTAAEMTLTSNTALPERRVTMADFLKNPIQPRQTRKRKSAVDETDDTETVESAKTQAVKSVPINMTQTSAAPLRPAAPQVQMVDGKIVLDVSSLTVAPTSAPATALTLIDESSQFTAYKPPSRRTAPGAAWTDEERDLLFDALAVWGTDFTTMSQVVFRGKRSRLQLRNRFRREEQLDPERVRHALLGKKKLTREICEQMQKEHEQALAEEAAEKEANEEDLV